MGLGQRPQVLGPTATRMGGVGWRLRGVGAMAKGAVHGEKGPRGKQGKGPRSVWNLGGRQRHPTRTGFWSRAPTSARSWTSPVQQLSTRGY